MPASTDPSGKARQDELVRTAWALAHAVNNRLVAPVGLPELEGLRAMAIDVLQLEIPPRDRL